MKSIFAIILLFSAQSFAAPTAYELSQALVTLTNANNEADGPYSFLVCQTDGNFYDSEDFTQMRSVSEYLVLRKGGEIDDVWQVNYSVITSYAFVVQSINRLNSAVVTNFACPQGTYQVYQETIQ
jgi:hypothetical protein